jgi:hypothetical protein
LLGIVREERAFVAALLRMTGKQRRRKEEADPSPIRASRVWAQDDSEKRLRQAKAQVKSKDKGKGRSRRPTLKTEGSGTRKGSRFFREL